MHIIAHPERFISTVNVFCLAFSCDDKEKRFIPIGVGRTGERRNCVCTSTFVCVTILSYPAKYLASSLLCIVYTVQKWNGKKNPCRLDWSTGICLRVYVSLPVFMSPHSLRHLESHRHRHQHPHSSFKFPYTFIWASEAKLNHRHKLITIVIV